MDYTVLTQLLDKLFQLNAMEKNNLYHFIVDTIKNCKDSRQAAGLVIAEFDNLLANKREELDGKVQDKQEGKVSPIFRRVS